jgi:hypothetical protein
MTGTAHPHRLPGARFARLGGNETAHVKRTRLDGEVIHAVHAADGTFLFLFLGDGEARQAALERGLVPQSVH